MRESIYMLLFFMLVAFSLTGQTIEWNKFDEIKSLKSDDPIKLSKMITSNYSNQKDKVMAIYYWITQNIEYDLKLYRKYKKQESKKKRKKYTEEEIEKIYKREVEKTLKKGKGVCKQYSLLFKELCIHSQIQCEYVSGFARVNPYKPKSKGELHAWNVVNIDGNWEMIDVTWGSGFVDELGEFNFRFNPNYFSTKKEIFIFNHFPRDEKWQFLDTIVEVKQFKKLPIISSGYIELEIGNLSPQKNVITVKKGQEIEITFNSNHDFKNINCYRLRRKKGEKEKEFEYYKEMVNCDFQSNENLVKIVIKSDKLKTGNYSFFSNGKKLFSYKIIVN